MNAIKKLIAVLAKNLGLTIVLFAAIILFAVFSDAVNYCIANTNHSHRPRHLPNAKNKNTAQTGGIFYSYKFI